MKFNWGTAIILFFILFISLCIAFMVFAFRQKQDLVEDDYYEKGAGYTKQMEIIKRSAAYQDSIGITVSDAMITFRVTPTMQAWKDSLKVYFFRPSNKHEDYHAMLNTSGSMAVAKTNLVAGRYLVKLSWSHNLHIFMMEKEIFIK